MVTVTFEDVLPTTARAAEPPGEPAAHACLAGTRPLKPQTLYKLCVNSASLRTRSKRNGKALAKSIFEALSVRSGAASAALALGALSQRAWGPSIHEGGAGGSVVRACLKLFARLEAFPSSGVLG